MSEFDNNGAKLAVAPDGDKGDQKSGVMPRPPRPAPASGNRTPGETPSVQVPSTETPSVDGLGPVPASLAWDDDDDDVADSGANDAYVGTTLGERYVVDEVIGEGGMGRVYLAHHKVIGKKVAIKILHAELARDKEAVGRFVREAKAASSIGNPHIVDISDFGELSDGSTYFVMEYLDGITLGELIEKGAVAPDLVCDIGLQMCDGLSAAHQQQIIHRDLKPDNVTLVTRGSSKHFCKILDFGIAKSPTSDTNPHATIAGTLLGTPHYMAPEQIDGVDVDARSDIYALGAVLYEMATGSTPFTGDTLVSLLVQHKIDIPRPFCEHPTGTKCSPALEAIIFACLEKRPEHRPQSAADLAALLRELR
jgi:serine/threonine-protein kinase